MQRPRGINPDLEILKDEDMKVISLHVQESEECRCYDTDTYDSTKSQNKHMETEEDLACSFPNNISHTFLQPTVMSQTRRENHQFTTSVQSTTDVQSSSATRSQPRIIHTRPLPSLNSQSHSTTNSQPLPTVIQPHSTVKPRPLPTLIPRPTVNSRLSLANSTTANVNSRLLPTQINPHLRPTIRPRPRPRGSVGELRNSAAGRLRVNGPHGGGCGCQLTSTAKGT